ncbi:MAG TPA: RAMP superfamily CRISPR-associated protein [Ktedonosporobacter sp.]|nr:RAMP superfamily CRISPR-associated protein [Ktedonosporobacter sp.]
MNPYDFARIDWARPPERRRPIWHHRLTAQDGHPLYSGHLEVDLYAETPLFIANPRTVSPDPKKPAQFMQNNHNEYIIPGSSLKGLLRCVVETLGNGCLTLFDSQYERGRINYSREVPKDFQHCSENTQLCMACRIFGMLKERTGGVFLGKVNISDATAYPDKIYKYDPIYTKPLMEPKPHHASFYLDESRQHIAGRKYYFHHPNTYEPLTERGLIFMGGRPANRYIEPLDTDTQFRFRLDFTNLEADEFAAVLLAITLEEGMRHKIGYGKPLGLGSVYLYPTRLTLVDYASRYTQVGNGHGTKVLEKESGLWQLIQEHIDSFYAKHLVTIAMEDLRCIWRWPPQPDVDYYYPSKRDWFDTEESRGKRIADTKHVP